MAERTEPGWVMIEPGKGPDGEDFVLSWTFGLRRRDAIEELEDLFPEMTRRRILRRWKPVRATRCITTS
jgi:hypothetical protein